jgi:hypothetical protein
MEQTTSRTRAAVRSAFTMITAPATVSDSRPHEHIERARHREYGPPLVGESQIHQDAIILGIARNRAPVRQRPQARLQHSATIAAFSAPRLWFLTTIAGPFATESVGAP